MLVDGNMFRVVRARVVPVNDHSRVIVLLQKGARDFPDYDPQSVISVARSREIYGEIATLAPEVVSWFPF